VNVKYRRPMGRFGRIYFWGTIVVFTLLAVLAAAAGWWLYTLIAVVLGVGFIVSAPFVLERGWRPHAPRPTKRPVVRRRR
jgi:hypothetical protein